MAVLDVILASHVIDYDEASEELRYGVGLQAAAWVIIALAALISVRVDGVNEECARVVGWWLSSSSSLWRNVYRAQECRHLGPSCALPCFWAVAMVLRLYAVFGVHNVLEASDPCRGCVYVTGAARGHAGVAVHRAVCGYAHRYATAGISIALFVISCCCCWLGMGVHADITGQDAGPTVRSLLRSASQAQRRPVVAMASADSFGKQQTFGRCTARFGG